jgi:rubrerythrin
MNSLVFAINTELEGAKYYREQAELNKANELSTVFLLLAKDEETHAEVLQNKLNKFSCVLKNNNTMANVKNIFKGIGNYKEKTIAFPKQIDLYRMALDKEKQSIKLYNEFLSEAIDDMDKQLFSYLVRQETDHLTIIDNLIMFVNRPGEWVESAEFGIREEY